VTLDGEQHVGERANHWGADRLAFVGAAQGAHAALVGGDAEMVRPEPHQPFYQAEVGGERGVDARLRLLEIELLRNAGTGIALGFVRHRLYRRLDSLCLHRIGSELVLRRVSADTTRTW